MVEGEAKLGRRAATDIEAARGWVIGDTVTHAVGVAKAGGREGQKGAGSEG